MPVEMRLSKIIISEINDNQVVFLKEVDGGRQFPILIGIFEATSIDRRVKKIPRPRPLTHDLLAGIIEAMGGELVKVFINELNEATYFAQLQIRQGDDILNIDARPSDAIAMAVTSDPPVPIFVDEDVLESALKKPEF
jgi:bifunctional DNase/RNase